jgi:hypothetical protein
VDARHNGLVYLPDDWSPAQHAELAEELLADDHSDKALSETSATH